MQFNVSKTVGLSIAHFRFKCGKKLAPTYILIKITKKVGPQAYQIILPEQYAKAYNVFLVFSLKP